jgi:hypothetical protein
MSKMPDHIQRDIRHNWHRHVMQFWPEVYNAARTGNIDAVAKQLLADQSRLKSYAFRVLALDLMCASFPKGQQPPDAVVKVMKAALGLPEDHQVGGWMVHPWRDGVADGRGDPVCKSVSAKSWISRRKTSSSVPQVFSEIIFRGKGTSAPTSPCEQPYCQGEGIMKKTLPVLMAAVMIVGSGP